MQTLDQLYVRACKSADPLTRLQSLHRRYFIGEWTAQHTVNRLAGIIDTYDIPFSVVSLVQRSSNEHYALFDDSANSLSYWERVMHELIYIIRYTSRDHLPNSLSIPAKFRSAA